MDVGVRIEGTDELVRTVAKAIGTVGDLRHVWPAIDRRFTDRTRRQFETGGALTGGWQPLSARYLAWKQGQAGVHASIMVKSGRLRNSLFNPFDPGAVHEASNLAWERGTRVISESGFPYPAAHQTGAGRLPKREVIVWDRSDTDYAVKTIGDLIGRALDG